jgi:hypothetical protein
MAGNLASSVKHAANNYTDVGLIGNNKEKIFGDGENAGLLGLGQYKAKGVDIDMNAFSNPNQNGSMASLSKQLRDTQRREAPILGEGAAINTVPQEQFRQGQLGLAQALQMQAMGQGPSLAQGQLRQATDRNIAQAMALGASQRGSNPALAQRQIALGSALANQQAAAQSAQLRMQEQMAARDQLGGVLQSGRGQDIGLATDQAGFNQQAILADQQARLQQQALNDAQSRFLNSGMMDLDQNNRLAQIAGQQLRVQQATGISSANQAGYANASQARGNFVQGAGQAAAAAASDENLKTDVVDGSAKIQEFLDTIGAHSYRYIDPKFGAGTYVSPMAQELEKTELGKGLVIETSEGKMVDYGKAFGLMFAAASALNKRVSELEQELKKGA